jgi:hypothetical protein
MNWSACQEDLAAAEPVEDLIEGGMLPKAPVPGLYDDIATETASLENQAVRFRRRIHPSGLGPGGGRTTIALLENVEAPGQGHHVFVPDIPTPA